MPENHPAGAINPYAAPATVSNAGALELAGVGAWCDGGLVVMHQHAQLPPICALTGEPATAARSIRLVWSYPIDWSSRVLNLNLPLCAQMYERHRRRVWWGRIAVFGPLAAAVPLFLVLGHWMATWLVSALAIANLIGMVIWIVFQLLDNSPIRFVRAKQRYLWLRGFHPRFLAQLPAWPN